MDETYIIFMSFESLCQWQYWVYIPIIQGALKIIIVYLITIGLIGYNYIYLCVAENGGGKDGVIPFGAAGELYMYPSVEDIKNAIRELAK